MYLIFLKPKKTSVKLDFELLIVTRRFQKKYQSVLRDKLTQLSFKLKEL